MVNTKRMLIAPIDIKTWYYDEVSMETAYKRLNALKKLGYDRCFLVVEKIGVQKYVLLEGYREYAALITLQPNVAVPCYVVEHKEQSSEQEQMIKILRKVVPLETTSWIFKNIHVMELIDKYKMEIKDIARLIGQDTSQVKKWVLDSRIPVRIRDLAYQNEALTMVKNICQSINIYEEFKPYLYERGVKPQGHKDRLKAIDFELLVLFCKTNRMPLSLLLDGTAVKTLIDKLLQTRFMIPELWRELLYEWFPHHFHHHYSPQNRASSEDSFH
jgi:hypothetical protein